MSAWGGMAMDGPYPPTAKEERTYDKAAETLVIVSDRTSPCCYLRRRIPPPARTTPIGVAFWRHHVWLKPPIPESAGDPERSQS